MPTYVDHLGREQMWDGHGELAWRVSIYSIALRGAAILMVEPAWAVRWELPGGAVETDLQETLVEAAVRECMEETGYHLTPHTAPELASESFFHLRAHNRYCHSLIFTIQGTVAGEPDPTWHPAPDEIRAVRWIPLASLTPETVYAPHWDVLQRLYLVCEPPA